MLEQTAPYNDFDIPAQPKILAELQLEQAKAEPSLAEYAAIIAKDVAVSASVLKTINSPYFGFKRKITDIRNAVVMLGEDAISNLVTFHLLRQATEAKKASISLEKFWDTAMQTAEMMRLVQTHFKAQSQTTAEDAYSFALFRDCGIPLMAIKYADYRTVLMQANASPEQVFTEVEQAHYPTDHAVVGYFVAKSWHLPAELCQLILRHHDPAFLDDASVSEAQKQLYAMVKLASNVLSAVKDNAEHSEWPLTRQACLEQLYLSEHDYQDLHADLAEAFRSEFGL